MAEVKRYRKRPVEVDAFQWDGEVKINHPAARWVRDNGGLAGWSATDPQHMEIHTLEGVMAVSPGDFIIRGVQGEFYPCKPDIFAQTYEPVEG